jgi:A/G-specific adenine glycosylase
MDTNIRRVFIHEFFPGRDRVRDDEILPLVERALDRKEPSRWYNALMDYGAMLKREHGNSNLRSAHYSRQSPFENSNRQVRGAIVKALVGGPAMTAAQIVNRTGMDAERVRKNLDQLAAEGFLVSRRGRYRIE